MEIKNSVAVITGGASGIGEIVAKNLANEGCKVVLGDMNELELNRVVKEITSSGGQAAGVICNVVSDDDVNKLMDQAVSKFGQINIVFANAGIIKDGLMVNTDKEGKVKSVMSTDDFQKVINVNLTGTFITLREGARRMIENKWKGVLLITTSINKVGQVGQINYSSTKAAVAMWPKIISAEFHMKGIKNIRTASIAPGYTATPILQGMNQDALQAILKDVHIDRLVEPDEIFKAVKFVIDNEAVDGTCIEVTGGVTYGPRAMVK